MQGMLKSSYRLSNNLRSNPGIVVLELVTVDESLSFLERLLYMENWGK